MPDGQVIKLVNATALDEGLTDIADAIREKGGTSADLAFPSGFISAINAIPTEGSVQKASGTFTGNDSYTITIQCAFEPDMVFIARSDIESMTAIADMSIGITGIARDMFMFYTQVPKNGTSMSGPLITTATGTRSTTRSSYDYFTYNNGTITYRCDQSNAARFRSALQYDYLAVKWT